MANQPRPTWDAKPTLPVRPHQAPLQAPHPATGSPLPDINKDPFARPAQTKTERLACLNKEHQDRPGDPLVREQIYEEVKEVVDCDPFLEYHAENTSAYRVIDRRQQVLIVPKERARPEPYPVQRPGPTACPYHDPPCSCSTRGYFAATAHSDTTRRGAALTHPDGGHHRPTHRDTRAIKDD